MATKEKEKTVNDGMLHSKRNRPKCCMRIVCPTRSRSPREIIGDCQNSGRICGYRPRPINEGLPDGGDNNIVVTTQPNKKTEKD